ATGSGTTLAGSLQVVSCTLFDGSCVEWDTILLYPDKAGQYEVTVTAELPDGDPLGPSTAIYSIVIDVTDS
ncbi:hypothetical protein ACFL6C_12095, partial [Myxococcota bacterium]